MTIRCDSDSATALFFSLCIPIRLWIVHLVRSASEKRLPVIGWIASVIALGFFTIYLFGLRNDIGIETLGCPIWWNDYRPIHGALYLLTAMYAFNHHKRYAYVPLLIDVFFSIFIKLI